MRFPLYSRPSTERIKDKTVALLSRTGENPAGVATGIEKRVPVRRDGILQPLLARPVEGDDCELVAGFRGYKATLEVGLAEVAAAVREMSPAQAAQYALTENLQREDLNPVEEVEGILQLLALKLGTGSQGAIALLHRLSKAKRGLADSAVRPEEQRAVEKVFEIVGRLLPQSLKQPKEEEELQSRLEAAVKQIGKALSVERLPKAPAAGQIAGST